VTLPTTLDPSRLAVGHTRRGNVVVIVGAETIFAITATQARKLGEALGEDAVLFGAMLLNSARAADEAKARGAL
jgi:hypothetical protein